MQQTTPSSAPTTSRAAAPPSQPVMTGVPAASAAGGPGANPAGAAACVGRDTELQRLAELLAEARAGAQRVVWLEGPSGVGKSRILAEFRGRVRLEGGVVLDGRCEPGTPFAPFAEIVDQALRFLDEVGVTPSFDPADLACHEGCHRIWHQHREPCSADPDALTERPRPRTALGDAEAVERRIRFFDAIRALLVDVARVRPPAVLLHDLERADRGTLALLAFLLDTSSLLEPGGPEGCLPALFVASVRTPSEGADGVLSALLAQPGAERIDVGALDASGVRALLQSEEMVRRVLARTGGLPEAIDALLDADLPSRASRIDRWLGKLPEAARAMVEALAVLRRPADLDLLARVTGATADAAARAELVRSDALVRRVVDGALLVAFAREADRAALYDALDPGFRRALHARCMEIFASGSAQGDVLDAAEHALLAGEVLRAVPLALQAARSLASRHAHAEAAALLERLVAAATEAAADGVPATVPLAVREQLSDLYRMAGDYRRALREARLARQAAPDDPAAARRVGDLMTLSGALEDAAAVLEEAHALALAAGDPHQTAEVEAALGELHYQRAQHATAQHWAERALAAAESVGALPLALTARNTLGKVALAQRDARSAAELFETNRRLAQQSGLGRQEAQALTNLGVAMLRLGELQVAEASFTRAVEVAVGATDTRERAIATENLAVLAHLRREWDRAQRCYDEAVALLKRLGNRAMLARVANNLGELYLSLGDRERARTLCEYATHVGGTTLPPSVSGEGLLLRGRIEAAFGHSGTARASFEAAERTFSRVGMARSADARLELARLALDDGDVERARALLATVPTSESSKRAAEVAVLADDLRRAEGGDVSDTSAAAVALAEAADDDALRLAAYLRRARALLDAGDGDGATRALEAARQADARLGAHVPPGFAEGYAARPERRELDRLEERLASAFTRRTASIPPARSAPGNLPAPRHGAAPGIRAHEARSGEWRAGDARGGEPRGDAAREALAEARRERYPGIVGSSAPIQGVLSMIDRVAPTDALVLIRGESGTGKELVAEAIHRGSPRRDRPLVKVNCAALVETLLLSELFGHERGAFTGATARKKGRFEVADGGTIFLDEIGDISPKTQVALLRVLQEREFERVGGTTAIKVDVRIVCATHRDLEKMVREGEFREDLYYRLRGVTLEVPPLRRRLDDLGELSRYLLERIAQERGEAPKRLSAASLRLLSAHRWPGNVRELDNVLRSATLFADGDVLEPSDLATFAEAFGRGDPEPEMAITPGSEPDAAASPGGVDTDEIERVYRRIRGGSVSLFEMKKVLERECIERALAETGGNITRAAALLGMKRPRLSQLVKEYGLSSATNGEA
jgi:DNA-binding NtrC family response regulator/tetratricopeptide (TPR) repeat protein